MLLCSENGAIESSVESVSQREPLAISDMHSREFQSTPSQLSIGIVSRLHPSAQEAWSGTIASIYRMLARKYRVVWIPARESSLVKCVGQALTILHRAFGWNFSRYHSTFTARSFARSVGKEVSQAGHIDVLFAPAGSHFIAFLETVIPIIYLSDATFANMTNYYDRFSNLPYWNKASGNLVEKRALQNASHVVLSSQWAKLSAIEHYGTDANKVSVIRFGPNHDAPGELKPSTARSVATDRINLLFLGVDWVRKGGEVALSAHKQLRDEYQVNSFLRIVGCSAAVGSDSSVDIIGYLDKSDSSQKSRFTEVLRSSHLLLLPTRAECAGIAFSEAIAAGIPVVTYATGGAPDYVLDGKTGVCLPRSAGPDDFARAVYSIISDPREYLRFSRECEKFHAETLNWKHWLSQFETILDRVCKLESPNDNIRTGGETPKP